MISGIVYLIVFIGWTIYSYTQIDLNLTLSSNRTYQYFQNLLIYLGYFNRPLSTSIFLILILLSFIFYFIFLRLVIKKKISSKQIVFLISFTTLILLFAYPAFSHDIFNYMFDARIVTKYHLNPYFYTALDFPADLWTRFMHWTHRTYPYGPVWLIITLPLSFIGMERFVPTLFLFKLFFSLFHLGNIYLIYKILSKISPKHSIQGAVFYAFNPLIIIESLVSPHNEVVMLFFLLLAIYYFRSIFWSLLFLLTSLGVKFITVILLPLFLLRSFFALKTREKSYLWMGFFSLLLAVSATTFYREPYPWYFIMTIGMGSLLVWSQNLVIVLSGLSIGVLLRYAPFLYFGEYSKTVSLWQSALLILPLAICLILACYNAYKIRQWKPL